MSPPPCLSRPLSLQVEASNRRRHEKLAFLDYGSCQVPAIPVGVEEVYDFHESGAPGALWRDWGVVVAWTIDLQRAVERFAFCLALDPS